MIDSMTGFGRGEASVKNASATVELRSVNNRYCEVSVRLPRNLSDRESDVQARIKQHFSRGRISAQIQVETTSDDVLSIQVDRESVRAYMNLLETVREVAGITSPVRLEHLLNYSDVFEAAPPPEDEAERMWEAVENALTDAMDALRTMRRQEGSALLADLEQRIEAIGRHLRRVEERAPARVEEARERLRERLRDVMEDERIDRDRLEMEMALVADRVDITEECVRLRSHLEMFRQALNSEHAEGRKLNFISQEINREINTIGAKANDADISHLAVEMKDELEKVREQVQNVE
ncbi:MAG: YicC/YloC family endoribonuclease [Rhodothermales bacterium]